jgi:cysteinyl-tRNA synthetase
MHNEMLQVEGKKMSKSLGNFFTVRDLLDQGYAGEVIRFVLLSTHYSKPMDWTEKKAREAEATLRKWRALTDGIEPSTSAAPQVIAALSDDLNTAGAITHLHALVNYPDVLLASARMLGFMEDGLGDWAQSPDIDLSRYADALGTAREQAMQTKDFSDVDRLKSVLIDAGIEVQMSKDGVKLKPAVGFDPSKLEALL